MEKKLSKWSTLTEKEKVDILCDGLDTDCSFIASGSPNSEAVHCHQIILSQTSEVFYDMFAKNAGEDLTNNEIRLDNVEANTVHQFIDFVYFGNKQQISKLSLQILKELVYLGENYKISDLSDSCLTAIDNIKTNISLRDIANFYEYAHRVDNKKLIELFNLKKTEWCKNVQRDQNDIYCSSIYDMSSACFMDFIKIFAKENVKHCFEMVQYYIKRNLSDKAVEGGNGEENLNKFEDDDHLKKPNGEIINREDISDVSKIDLKSPENNSKILADTSNKRQPNINEGDNSDASQDDFKDKGTISEASKQSEISKNQKGGCGKLQEDENSSKESKTYKKNKLIINMLLNLIDFKSMSLVEFLNGPINSDLLDANTKLEVLAEIVPKN
ncbi:uncharacterized protein LOC119668709 [Teleopsis dalmanni]|uniref:uncharacterized protein LOC119668709 n=1 Tax=Teleopsis dalmanni TaxID=139649 RepID=UPI0018CEFC46|nr:uncharacterized protein LOC119668709 [Teleopsis dalmanni]